MIGVGVDSAGPRLHHSPRRRIARGARKSTPPRTRRRPSAACPAPPVLEFDRGGQHGPRVGRPGPGLSSGPSRTTASRVDRKGNVWIGGNGGERRPHPEVHARTASSSSSSASPYASAGSNDPWAFNKVAKVSLDEPSNEAYVADGYGNKRVAVIDMDTGKIKRYWGAYGNKPDDTQRSAATTPTRRSRSSSATRCTAPSCRTTASSTSAIASNDRIQVFTKDGKFVKESRRREEHARRRLGVGHRLLEGRRSRSTSTWPTARNEKIRVFDRAVARPSSPASATADASPASSTPCTASPPTRRATSTRPKPTAASALQKFVYKGLGPVTKREPGHGLADADHALESVVMANG